MPASAATIASRRGAFYGAPIDTSAKSTASARRRRAFPQAASEAPSGIDLDRAPGRLRCSGDRCRGTTEGRQASTAAPPMQLAAQSGTACAHPEQAAEPARIAR
ncbi:hypothetical protein P4233_01690 [Pseudomonas aeruginosa]|nr:hypothetical protein [Pseudomonas aeruginosa]